MSDASAPAPADAHAVEIHGQRSARVSRVGRVRGRAVRQRPHQQDLSARACRRRARGAAAGEPDLLADDSPEHRRGHAAAPRCRVDHAVAGRDRDRPAVRDGRGRGLARADLRRGRLVRRRGRGGPGARGRRAHRAVSSRARRARPHLRRAARRRARYGAAPGLRLDEAVTASSATPARGRGRRAGAGDPRRRRGATRAAGARTARLPRRSEVQQHPLRGDDRRPPASSRCA